MYFKSYYETQRKLYDDKIKNTKALQEHIRPHRYDLGRFGAIAEELSPAARKKTDEAIREYRAAVKKAEESSTLLTTDELQILENNRDKILDQLNATLTSLNNAAGLSPASPTREYNPIKFRQFLGEIFERLGELTTTTADASLAREIEKIKSNIPDKDGKISADQAKSILHKILHLLPNIYHAVTAYINDMAVKFKASRFQVKGYEDTLVAKAFRGFKKPK
jgi:hypothetical protein